MNTGTKVLLVCTIVFGIPVGVFVQLTCILFLIGMFHGLTGS